MRKVRALLKLCFEKSYNARQVAKAIGIGNTSATEYLAGFKASGLAYCSIAGISDVSFLRTKCPHFNDWVTKLESI